MAVSKRLSSSDRDRSEGRAARLILQKPAEPDSGTTDTYSSMAWHATAESATRRIQAARAEPDGTPRQQQTARALEIAEALSVESQLSQSQIVAFVDAFVNGRLSCCTAIVEGGGGQSTSKHFLKVVKELALQKKLPCPEWALKGHAESVRPVRAAHVAVARAWSAVRYEARPAFVAIRKQSLMREPVVGAGM